MVSITVTGLKQIRRRLHAGQNAIPLASAKALTFTAERAQKRVTQFIPQVFSNPTPFTRRSIRKTSARPSRLEAQVFFKDISLTREHYLAPQVRGGSRPQKPAEKRLGGYWVPGKEARRNKYGNLTQGTWSKILADVGRFGLRTGDAANTLTRRQGGTKRILFFMRRHKNGKRIIYKKVGKRIVPWLIEVTRPRYRRRLPFSRIVTTVMTQQYGRLFDKAMQRELAKAG